MKVTLVDYTGNGSIDPSRHAAALLVFTKNTRLTMSPSLLGEIHEWPMKRLLDELEYMSNTIPSSWEFVDYVYMIEGVSRAFTHQMVRTRTASFAQQTMRVLDVSEGKGWDYLTGPSIESNTEPRRREVYDGAMETIADVYRTLIELGAEVEDARGVLPTNILTNIVVKMNMRTLVELIRKRTSPRVQGVYRQVLQSFNEEAARVHPWISLFINRDADAAARELYAYFKTLPAEEKLRLSKLLDKVYAR